ncbi:MAG: Rieske 2Fe-2S domain-containing protein [Thermoleophilia bacterium]
MWCELARCDDIAAGGMKYVQVGEREVCLCEYDGDFFAVSRRCGHQNVPLDEGALAGWVLTCPLHNVQFDVRDGRSISPPIDHDMGAAALPEPVERFFQLEKRLRCRTRVHDLHTYRVRVRGGAIEVDMPDDTDT